jgi:crossover junction endodeoxyribonuclease RuvC
MVILGVDPGLRCTGYGVIEASPDRVAVITAGDIRPETSHPLEQRLGHIHDTLLALLSRHRAQAIVLEKIFTHYKHITTATLMAHARGVACVTAQERGIPLAEYPATHVKKSLTGNGAASKDQVARMLEHWIRIDASWSVDATDALALAVVHAQSLMRRRNLPVELAG